MRESWVVGSILTDAMSFAVVLALFVYLCLQYAVVAFRSPTSNPDGRLVLLMRGTTELRTFCCRARQPQKIVTLPARALLSTGRSELLDSAFRPIVRALCSHGANGVVVGCPRL